MKFKIIAPLILCNLLITSSIYAKDHVTKKHSFSSHNLPQSNQLTSEEWQNIKSNIKLKSQSLYSYELSSEEWNEIVHQSKITSIDDDFDDFGYSIDFSGDTLVIGAPREDSNSTGVNGDQLNNLSLNSGAAYVFIKTESGWVQQAFLKASNSKKEIRFGSDVSIDGDTIVVSAPKENIDVTGVNGDQNGTTRTNIGSVYVFKRNENIWVQEAYLKPSTTHWNMQFGTAVSISGNTIAVSAINESSPSTGINGDEGFIESGRNSGAVYIFTKNNSTWSQEAYVKASNTNSSDHFGQSLDLDGNTLVVGAIGERSNDINNQDDNSIQGSGATYVYKKENNNWQQTAYLKAPNPDAHDGFGNAVAVHNDKIVIGAPGESSSSTGINNDNTDNSSESSGAAYLFINLNNNWEYHSYIKASNTDTYDDFGLSVAIFNNTLLISAPSENTYAYGVNGVEIENEDSIANNGAIYVFQFSENSLQQTSYIKTEDPSSSGLDFGFDTAISNDIIMISARYEINRDTNNQLTLGAVHTYDYNYNLFPIQAAHSALWYNPEESGHGLNVYMMDDNRVVIVWYVYDNEGNPLWLIGTGSHDGFTATIDVSIANGALFPPDFNADDVTLTDWGQFELSFTGCDAGLFKWFPLEDNGFTAGETQVSRLIRAQGLECSEDGQTSKQLQETDSTELYSENGLFNIQAAHSALWYNPEQSGHGFNIYMLDDNRMVAVWYVYDNQGRPLWLIGTGSHDGTTGTIDVSIANGALFPPLFDADDVNLESWGQFEVQFYDCNSGLFKWIPNEGNGFSAGETDVRRLITTQGLTCTE